MTDEERQAFSDFVYNVLKQESFDLLEISMSYKQVMKTGIFNGRRHPKDLAEIFAKEFAIRSDALDIMAEYLNKEMRNFKFEKI